MRILYGVVGEGMGHATRSRVILDHLLQSGHEVRVVVSGRAHGFLRDTFQDRKRISIDEIHGLTLSYADNALKVRRSLKSNIGKAPRGILKNIAAYRRVAEAHFVPDVVVSDFESWAYLYARRHRLPVISIDNQQVITRCEHDKSVRTGSRADCWLSKVAVKAKLPGAYHYLVTSFFFPPVRKKRTTLVPPILRPEILAAEREPRDHIVVYQTSSANELLVPLLRTLPYEFRVYGMGKEGDEGNVKIRPFSQHGFVDDLRTCRGLIAGGGYSLMGEAVHLHVPLLSVPVEKQFEQELNARYLEKLGYGQFAPKLSREVVEGFLGNLDVHAQALERYTPRDNRMVLGCVDELLRGVALDEPRPVQLESPAMAKYEGPLLPEEKGQA